MWRYSTTASDSPQVHQWLRNVIKSSLQELCCSPEYIFSISDNNYGQFPFPSNNADARWSAWPHGLITSVWDCYLLPTMSFYVSPAPFPENLMFSSNFELLSVYHAVNLFQSNWVSPTNRWVTSCCLPTTQTFMWCIHNILLLIRSCGSFKEIYGGSEEKNSSDKVVATDLPLWNSPPGSGWRDVWHEQIWVFCSLNQVPISKCPPIHIKKDFLYHPSLTCRHRNNKRQMPQVFALSSMFRLGQ